MKLLLIIFLAISLQAQTLESDSILYVEWYLYKIENVGDTACHHEWVTKDLTRNADFLCRCSKYHGIAGCPRTWGREGKICIYCLRKEIWREHRKAIPRPKSEYDRLDQMIKNKSNNK